MTTLPQEAVLSTLAEMGIAVVGFSLVAGILRPQSQNDERRLFTLRGVAGFGLIVATMSVFPLVAHSYSLPTDSTWRLSSGIVFVWAIAGIAADFVRLGYGLPAIAKRLPFTSGLVSVLILVNVCLLGMNIVSPDSDSGSRYATVMMLALAQAGFMFLAIAFDGRGETAP